MEANTQNGSGVVARGFTLVELMIVVSIILILISMAAPIYRNAVIRAREAVLGDNLFTMRQLIDEYTMDKQKAPQSLEDLVSGGYIRQVPRDPFTGSNTTWQTVMEDSLQAVDQTAPGIIDVKSGSDKTSLDGTPYNTW
ncbi:MAG: prepilin-type N-terminal cleavage/methylation domain-containing protein [Acidobacteria bacterium]|jgi:general secretion pathway protein G|nr:prepilin-type N-terminal cleavage/methylation domain-containing protein [Acidobacteriota bacterium]